MTNGGLQKWLLLHFHPPNPTQQSPGAHANRTHQGRRVLGNAVQPSQADTLQSYHDLMGNDALVIGNHLLLTS